MGRLIVRQESFAECFDEALPLIRRHWREIAHYADIPLDIDIDGYRRLDREGLMRCYIVRNYEDGFGVELDEIVGYAVFTLFRNAHYMGSLQAKQDVVYVGPEFRKTLVALRLLRYAEDALREIGVQLVQQHVKLAHPALGKLLSRQGYETAETIYYKRLDTVRGEVVRGAGQANNADRAAPTVHQLREVA